MCLMGAGLLKVAVIQLLDFGVLMGLPERHSGVLRVQTGGANSAQVFEVADEAGLMGLTAAVYTAAGASHDFDEVIILLAGLDHIEQLACVLKTAGNGNIDVHTGNLDRGFLDGLGAADGVDVEVLKGLAFEYLINGSESGFHNTAGCAEYVTRAGSDAEEGIALLIGKLCELNAGFLYHLTELTGCEGYVDCPQTVCGKLVARSLELLGCAGHYADNNDVLGIDARLLGIVGLDESAEHALGAAAGGQVLDELRIVGFAELDPSG